jgi:hypothetical protein
MRDGLKPKAIILPRLKLVDLPVKFDDTGKIDEVTIEVDNAKSRTLE